MTPISRLDSFEAGTGFTIWVFSEGNVETELEVRAFASALHLEWTNIEDLRAAGETLKIIDLFEHAAPKSFPWFDLGQTTIFLSNMAATGAPDDLLEAALRGYRKRLESAGIRVIERDRVDDLLRKLKLGDIRAKADVLSRLQERLRDQALIKDELEKSREIVNEINIQDSTIGVLNLGKVTGNITANVNALAENGPTGAELAQAISALTAAIGKATDLDPNRKLEALENVEALSEQAKLHANERKAGVFKAALAYLPTLLSSVTSIASIWTTAEPMIKSFFGM